MKFIPKQCRECPFRRNSLAGWLGAYTAPQVFETIWRGQAFFCHDSIDYDDPDWCEKAMSDPKEGKLCVGGLEFANRIHAPTKMNREDYIQHPIVIEAREKVRLLKGIECMDAKEFLGHHGGKSYE